MSERDDTPDLRALEKAYDITGELRGPPHTRRYHAHRREDGIAVMITLARAWDTGENNALAHLASDTQLLTNVVHPSVARVLGGHWLGSDAFAVVTERIQGDTLGEVVSRGDPLPNTRIAVVLQEVDGVLDWARSQGVVHRKVTPETLFFERGSDRAIVSFAPTAIPITGVPDARGDAKTIGELAWTMLAGRPYEEGVDGAGPSFAALAPNLATRVVSAVEKMVRGDSSENAPDVASLLAVIASGDVLKQAEVALAALEEEFAEKRRQILEKHEQERVQFENEAKEHRELLARERAEFERIMHRRQEQLAEVRAELEKQRADVERRLEELEERREALERRWPGGLIATNSSAKARKQLAALRPRRSRWRPTWGVRWAVPLGVAGVVLLLLAGFVAAIGRRRTESTAGGGVSVVAPNAAAKRAAADSGLPPTGRGGLLTQSAGGTLGRQPAPPAPRPDSALVQDSTTKRDTMPLNDTLVPPKRDTIDTLSRAPLF
jgi:hypothetical protein